MTSCCSPESLGHVRVVHIVTPGVVGGLERVVQTLASEQHAAGADVHVAAIVSRGDGEVADRFLAPLRSAGVVGHRLELPPRSYRRERRELAALCRDIRPEIVHTHGYRADLVDGGVARTVGAAAVTTLHGFTGGGIRNRCYEALQRRAARGFDAVVAVSRPLACEMERAGVPAERVHFVPNAWRPSAPPLARAAARQSLGLPPNDFFVGWAGRLSHEKGLDVLLDALASLHPLPVNLAVLGDGPERPALEQRAARHGIGERVRWHGFVPEADTLFAAFDVFVLSSRTEGTPMVLFEALASAVPIVATRVGGIPDVITADEGTLIDPGHSLALASAIRSLYRDGDSARERAQLARARLNASNRLGAWVAEYDTAYTAAVAAAAAR
jgi:glycosyltransferase involved in cell wall biosynthesis